MSFLGGMTAGAGVGGLFGGIGAPIGGLIGGIGGALGLFEEENPNAWAGRYADRLMDKENPFYGNAAKDYYTNLQQTLSAASPTTNSLLGAQMARGGGYKGSMAAANAQRNSQQTRIADTAMRASSSFLNRLYGQGMQMASNLYGIAGRGAEGTAARNASMQNNLIGLGGGLMGNEAWSFQLPKLLDENVNDNWNPPWQINP